VFVGIKYPINKWQSKCTPILLQGNIKDHVSLMPAFFSSSVVTDRRVQSERNAVMLDFILVKKCAAVYPHIGKDRLWISEESTTCYFGVHFSIRTKETLL